MKVLSGKLSPIRRGKAARSADKLLSLLVEIGAGGVIARRAWPGGLRELLCCVAFSCLTDVATQRAIGTELVHLAVDEQHVDAAQSR